MPGLGRSKKIFELLFLITLFFISSYCFFLGTGYFDLRTYHYDEGIITYGATRILKGDLPYGGFWTLYAPGAFYVLAGVFKVLGVSLGAARMVTVSVLALTACGVYWLVRRISSVIFGIFAFLFAIAWFKSYMVYNRPGQLAILPYLFCAVSLLNFFDTKHARWLFISGALAGLSCLFRQDFGIYIFFSVFLTILLRSAIDRKIYKSDKQEIFKQCSWIIFGFSSVVIPVTALFLFNVPARDLVYDTLVFPLLVYPGVRGLPLPGFGIENLLFYIPMAIFLISGTKILFFSRRAVSRNNNFWLSVFLWFSGLLFMSYANIRSCFSHLLPVMVPVIILFVLLAYDVYKNAKGHRFVLSESLFCIIVGLAVFFLLRPSFLKYAKMPAGIFSRPAPPLTGRIDVVRASGFYDGSEFSRSVVSAVKYIQEHTPSGEKIFVGNSRHDRLVNSDVLFYFLSQRDSATKYYELHPGMTDTAPVQLAIIEDLKKHRVNYVVLWSGSEDMDEPNRSSRSSGITFLDDFIRDNYAVEIKIGPYAIMKKIA